MKIVIYFDMDGVLAKWNTNTSQEETKQKGYFANREREDKVISLIKDLVNSGYDIRILSCVYQDAHSAEDKRVWLSKVGLDNLPKIFVPFGESKRKYISHDLDIYSFLIDDFTQNLKDFERDPNNVGIKFYNGVNGNFGSWAGFSISNQMSEENMLKTLMSIFNTYEKKAM